MAVLKPRHNLLPLTDEDTEIWHQVVNRFYMHNLFDTRVFAGLWSHSLQQGRRDADLMYFLARQREANLAHHVHVPLVHCLVFIDPEWPIGHHIVGFV